MIKISLIRKVKTKGDYWTNGKTLTIEDERKLRNKISKFLYNNFIMAKLEIK